MTQTIEQQNKALVLKAFNTLFNEKDYAAAEKFWSPDYVQHSAHIPPGRDPLFGLVKASPAAMRYENSLIMADGDMLMLRGRFTNKGGPAAWIAADVVRVEDGRLAEQRDGTQGQGTGAGRGSGTA